MRSFFARLLFASLKKKVVLLAALCWSLPVAAANLQWSVDEDSDTPCAQEYAVPDVNDFPLHCNHSGGFAFDTATGEFTDVTLQLAGRWFDDGEWAYELPQFDAALSTIGDYSIVVTGLSLDDPEANSLTFTGLMATTRVDDSDDVWSSQNKRRQWYSNTDNAPSTEFSLADHTVVVTGAIRMTPYDWWYDPDIMGGASVPFSIPEGTNPLMNEDPTGQVISISVDKGDQFCSWDNGWSCVTAGPQNLGNMTMTSSAVVPIPAAVLFPSALALLAFVRRRT